MGHPGTARKVGEYSVEPTMTRRKLPFNLRETFGFSRPEAIKSTKPPARILLDDYSPPPTPYIGRRSPLPIAIEAELRRACKEIATNTIPSDAFIVLDHGPEILEIDFAPDRTDATLPTRPITPGKKYVRNFSLPGADLTDFPVPNAGPNRTKYPYSSEPPPLVAVAERSPNQTHSEQSKRTDASLRSVDKTSARTSIGQLPSKSMSKAAAPPNVAYGVPTPLRNSYRSSNPLEFDGLVAQTDFRQMTTTISGGNSKHASYQEPVIRKDESGTSSVVDGERVRKRRSWYKVFSGSGETKPNAALDSQQQQPRIEEDTDTTEDPRFNDESRAAHGSRSRARSMQRGIRKTIILDSRPGESGSTTRSPSRSPSQSRSRTPRRRDSISSVRPQASTASRFTWNLRQPWLLRRVPNDKTDDVPVLHRPRKTKSLQSLRNRLSLNFNGNPPPLPSMEVEAEREPIPFDTTSNSRPVSKLLNRNIEMDRPSLSTRDERASHRKSTEVRPSTALARAKDVQRKLHFRKSYSDMQTAQRALQLQQQQETGIIEIGIEESPVIPQAVICVPDPKNHIPEIPRIPSNKTNKSTPTDSVMDGQVGVATPASSSIVIGMKDIPSPPPTDPLPAPPSQGAPSVPQSTVTPPSATSVQAKRRSSYSWLPVDTQVPTSPPRQQRVLRPSHEIQPMGVPSAAPSRGTERQQSTVSAFSVRSVDLYNSLQAPQYQYAEDISTLQSELPPSNPGTAKKKLKLPWEKKKPMTWMDEMEKLGINHGMLMVDQLNGPPIVRY